MMSSKVVSKLQQQLSKKPISFSRFNAIHNAGSIKSQPMFQPLIQTRMVNTSNKAVLRDTSYPFDWRRKEHEIPELPVGEEMPAQVEASVLGSDIVIFTDSILLTRKPYMREHIGKIFNFTPAEVTKFFPEGPSSRIIRSLEGFTKGNLGFLVREQSVQTVSYLEKSLAEGFKSPYLFLDGREGSGKSIVLNQAVHWARSNGWLVIFLNNGSDFINGNFFTRSTIFPGMYEQPELGEILLKGFLAAHAEQIKTIPLRTDVEVEGFERKENATLYDLVKFGVEYNESVQSCAVLFYVLRELNLVTEFPVLLAIDGVNYFHQNSRRLHDPMGDEESPHKLGFPRMPGDKLVLANLFRNYKKNNLINGTQIVTMTHFPNYDAKYMENTSLRPDRRNVLNIPPYTKEEFSIISEYYYKTGVTRADLSARSREYIYFLNEGLPGPLLSYMITYN